MRGLASASLITEAREQRAVRFKALGDYLLALSGLARRVNALPD
jgi:hypothetical protein